MLPTGSILHGNYRIDSYLSSGGFGNTYVATHILFNETYAIKEFFMKDISERGQDSSSVRVSNAGKTEEFNGQLEKFRKEALRLRKLHNAHIVRVYDLFNENGTAYYVMDYINGENLKERLQRTGQPMDEKEVRDVLEQVLEALQEVHGQGIWHMDLKPANVMIDRAGVVKLIDFGASKQFNSDTGGAVSTSAVAYTNGYAPREQMERSYEKFGPWTDFYALGATLYNLLTLKHPPMPGDIDDDPSPDKHDALPMPAKVTPQMRGLVLWLIKTNRKQRPQNVQQIKEFLNPSLPKHTPPPVINFDQKTLTLNVSGMGTLHVYLNGREIQVPCTFPQQMQQQDYLVTATAQAGGDVMSKEASLRVVIPALKQTALPEISYDPKTLTLNVTGNGEVHVLLNGKEIQVPYTFEKQRQEQSFNVTATAQASGELKSEVANLQVAVPALNQTAAPAISYDSDSLTLNVKGNGNVHVLLNGKEIKVPYTFEQKGSEASYQVTASAQAKGELKSEEATLKVVVPALMVLKEVVDETQIEAKEQPKPFPKDETNLKSEPKPAVNMGKPVPAVNVATPVSKPYESDDEPESKSRKLWPVILAACAGLLLVVGLYALFHNSDSTPTQPEEQAAEEAVEQVEAAEEVKTVENMQVVIPLCADGTSCTYSGPVDTDGMPDGEGTARFDNGDMLEGTFKNGDAEGENCKYYFHSGDRFEGSMQKNTFVKGRYYYQKDGSYFDGSFKDYRPKDGTWYDKNGKEIK